MRFLFLKKALLFLTISLLAVSLVQETRAFNMTISPAKKIFELERGQTKKYKVTFIDGSKDGTYVIRAQDYVFAGGVRRFIPEEEMVDGNQSLSSWLEFPEQINVTKDERYKFDVLINVPEDAAYGDYFTTIFFNGAKADGGGGPVAVEGSVGSLLMVKVLGGNPIKDGELLGFEAETRERARNTVDFSYEFENQGNVFYDVMGVLEIIDAEVSNQPLKVLKTKTMMYPNVKKEVKVPLGDLGDNASEKEYTARLMAYEIDGQGELGELYGEKSLSFYYNIPVGVHGSAPEVVEVEKEVVVTAPIIDIVKELVIYIGAFLIILIVLVRFLFFHKSTSASAVVAEQKPGAEKQEVKSDKGAEEDKTDAVKKQDEE